MAGIFDDEYRMSNSMSHSHISDKVIYDKEKIEEAKKWEVEENTPIITPTNNLQELEDKWILFNTKIKHSRKESDWKSLELFGCTNKENYDKIKAYLLKDNIENDIDNIDDTIQNDNETIVATTESYIDPASSYYRIFYTNEDVKEALVWSKESDRVIILPTRTLADLEELWNNFNEMIYKHRRESDWKSIEYFGITNQTHYEYLKSKFLKKDIDDHLEKIPYIESSSRSYKRRYIKSIAENEPISEFYKLLLNMTLPKNSIYEDVLIQNVISDAISDFDNICISNPDIQYNDYPFYTSSEMDDLGVFSNNPEDNYYGVLADNAYLNDIIETKKWFEEFCISDKIQNENFSNLFKDWTNKVRELSFGLKKMKESNVDENTIKSRKQSLLELGWNPEIEFTDKARKMCTDFYRVRNFSDPTKIINLCEFDTDIDIDISLYKSTQVVLYPIYIVLVEGKAFHSEIIKKVTKNTYTHASIGFDSALDKLYSFNNNKKTNSLDNKSGISMEDIHKLDNNIGVFVFFVPINIFNLIKEKIDSFLEHAKDTTYSFLNLVTFFFHIQYEKEWSLICSQFVDRILKFAGIDITKKASSLVSPADIYQVARHKKYIYKLYEGPSEKYNRDRVDRVVSSISKRAKALKENNVIYDNETKFINDIINSSNSIDKLKELKTIYKDILYNKSTINILENVIIPYVTEAKPYYYSMEEASGNNVLTLDDINNIIKLNVKSL